MKENQALPDVVLIPHTAVGEGIWRSARAKLYHHLGHKVFVSDTCQLKSNPEAYELLFQKNPYISGEKSPVPGDILDGVITEAAPFKRTEMEPDILKARDFPVEQRKLEIHYHPRLRGGLHDVVFLDLNISSYRLVPGGRDDFSKVEDYVLKHYPNAVGLVREDYNLSVRGFEPLPVTRRFPSVSFRSIYDYCDLVASCARVVCLQTGSEMLACHFNGRVDCLRTEDYYVDPANRNRLHYIDCEINDIDLR